MSRPAGRRRAVELLTAAAGGWLERRGADVRALGSREPSRELGRVRSARDRQSAGKLARALERQELRLAYQPIVHLQTGEPFAIEALLRWDHPEHGALVPQAFVPLAEATGLIVPIGDWVLAEACRASARFEAACPREDCPLVAVNVSVRQLQDPRFSERAEAFVASAGVHPGRVCLEVTETILADRRAIAALERLKQIGFRIAVDDFLTGYSSLRYLRQFPVNSVKVDRSFTAAITKDGADYALVKAVVTLAHAIGMTVVAEGIDSGGQLAALRRMRCDFGQGYHFAEALSANDIERSLARDLRWLGAASAQELAPNSEPRGGLGARTEPGPP